MSSGHLVIAHTSGHPDRIRPPRRARDVNTSREISFAHVVFSFIHCGRSRPSGTRRAGDGRIRPIRGATYGWTQRLRARDRAQSDGFEFTVDGGLYP